MAFCGFLRTVLLFFSNSFSPFCLRGSDVNKEPGDELINNHVTYICGGITCCYNNKYFRKNIYIYVLKLLF